jgi:biotin carboxylase
MLPRDMDINIVFLSPHFPNNHKYYCQRLHEAGIRVLGIDQIPRHSLCSDLGCCFHDYYQVNDLQHYSELAQACRYFIDHYGPIHRIESHNEHWLETQAQLATDFQVSGLTNDRITYFKRKSEMKKIYIRAGFTPARGELLTSLDAALSFAHQVGYPLMLKPDIGVGAFGCCKIHSELELNKFFEEKPSQDYLMEEFIDGDMWSFDGLVNGKGNLLFHTSHVYGAGIAEVVQQDLNQFYYSLRDIPEELEKIGRKTLAAFDVKERFFHFEYFLTHKDKRWVPVEVNMRPPGGLTMEMCNFACDIDLYQMWAQLMAGRDDAPSYERKYHCMSISRRHSRRYIHSHEEVMHQGRHLLVHHDTVPPVFHKAMGDYVYLACAPHLQPLQELQQYIHRE